jgi:hypothetical protein
MSVETALNRNQEKSFVSSLASVFSAVITPVGVPSIRKSRTLHVRLRGELGMLRQTTRELGPTRDLRADSRYSHLGFLLNIMAVPTGVEPVFQD